MCTTGDVITGDIVITGDTDTDGRADGMDCVLRRFRADGMDCVLRRFLNAPLDVGFMVSCVIASSKILLALATSCIRLP